MKRMMELLGEDGMDEFDAAQLDALAGPSSAAGSDEDKDEDEENWESESGSGDEDEEGSISGEEDEEEEVDGSEAEQVNGEEGGGESEEEEDVIALDDVENGSVDEDVVPRQKVVIDNKVSTNN